MGTEYKKRAYKKKAKEIVIIVKGDEEDREMALTGLLSEADYGTRRNAVASLCDEQLKDLAKAVHGELYTRID